MEEAIVTKIDELKQDIRALRASETLAKGTVSTQSHLKTRDIHILTIMQQLLNQIKSEDIKFTGGADEWFDSLTCPKEMKGGIRVKEGDAINDLLQKYSDTKDVFAKIQKACEKQGLGIDFVSGTIKRI